VVVDLKTSARKYTDLQVETALQLSVYSYAVGLNSFAGGDDVRLRFDVLTKTRVPELHRYWTTRDRAANVRLFRLVAEVPGAIEAGGSTRSSGGSARTACSGAGVAPFRGR
jgi:hypothetical protein